MDRRRVTRTSPDDPSRSSASFTEPAPSAGASTEMISVVSPRSSRVK